MSPEEQAVADNARRLREEMRKALKNNPYLQEYAEELRGNIQRELNRDPKLIFVR